MRIINRIKNMASKLHDAILLQRKYRNLKFAVSSDEKPCINPFPLQYIKERPFDEGLVEKILSNHIILFGKLYQLEVDKWNYDYENNYDWGIRFYKFYRFASYDGKKDPKYALELSRLNHIFYGWSYGKMCSDPAANRWAESSLINWIEKNPIGFGFGWSCAMDVALRAVNLVIMWSHCDDSGFQSVLSKAIREHEVFLLDNLENKGRVNNNHYFTDLIGLAFLSIALNHAENIRFALREIEKEAYGQILADGVDFEGSVSYHRFVFQLLFYLNVLLENNHIHCPFDVRGLLDKMYSFLFSVQSQNLIPLFGDCDNSFLVNMDDYEMSSPKEISSLAALYLKTQRGSGETIKRNCFQDAGYYVLENEVFKAVIRCGAIRGNGGHYHNDQLSYVLYVNGEELFIDRGLFSYYGDYKMRNACRSTASHNVYCLDGCEQNHFEEKNIFHLDKRYIGHALGYDGLSFDGVLHGYAGICTFQRKCSMKGSDFLEEDSVSAGGGHIRYFIAPQCDVRRVSTTEVIVTGTSFQVSISSSEEIEVEDTTHFIGYGMGNPCHSLMIRPQNSSCILKISSHFI